jgi:2-oxoglutarate dehydrogenase E1 component
MQRHNVESVLYSQNGRYVLDLYKQYHRDPASIGTEWQEFFKNVAMNDFDDEIPFLPPRHASNLSINQTQTNSNVGAPVSKQEIIDSIRALMLVRAFRVRGHLLAKLDPLGLEPPKYHSELDPQNYGFKDQDYTRPIYMDGVLGLQQATLAEIMDKLKKTYCGSLGVEFMHIQNPEQKAWLQYQFEGRNIQNSNAEKLSIYQSILRAEAFEKFLHVKFPGAKRFGLDGGESLMPALDILLKTAAENKLRELIIGMAHRGRLSVLTNFLMQPMRYVFAQFQGTNIYNDEDYGYGDVKYHSGF